MCITTLPINNFHRYDDARDWLDIYSHHYPSPDEQEDIYMTGIYQPPFIDEPSTGTS